MLTVGRGRASISPVLHLIDTSGRVVMLAYKLRLERLMLHNQNQRRNDVGREPTLHVNSCSPIAYFPVGGFLHARSRYIK